MQENRNAIPDNPFPRRTSTMPAGFVNARLVAGNLTRFIDAGNGTNGHELEELATRITVDTEPAMQSNLFDGVIVRLIRSWAGRDDLSRENARVIEDCRKICDLMGWRPLEEKSA